MKDMRVTDNDYYEAGIPRDEPKPEYQVFSNVPEPPLMNERKPLKLEEITLANFNDPEKWKLL